MEANDGPFWLWKSKTKSKDRDKWSKADDTVGWAEIVKAKLYQKRIKCLFWFCFSGMVTKP